MTGPGAGFLHRLVPRRHGALFVLLPLSDRMYVRSHSDDDHG